jgi:hypothetical protein
MVPSVEVGVLLVGVRSRWRQQEEGFSFGEGKYEGGYEVQLEAAWTGELDTTRPTALVQSNQKLIH